MLMVEKMPFKNDEDKGKPPEMAVNVTTNQNGNNVLYIVPCFV